MKLKLDKDGHVALENDLPVYIYADGQEKPYDAPATAAHIKNLNKENAGFRVKSEELEKKLKTFGDYTPDSIADLLKKSKKTTDSSDGLTAEFEKAKSDMQLAFDASTAKLTDQINAEKMANNNLLLDSRFASSGFIESKIGIPRDMFKSFFAGNFKVVDEGQVRHVVGQINGENIMSKTNPGHVAGFEEALETIVAAYPKKEEIMKGAKGGSGGAGGAGSEGGELTSDQRVSNGLRKLGVVG